MTKRSNNNNNNSASGSRRRRPSLGRGMAEGAARAIENRNRRLRDQIDKAAGFNRND